ncbi:hypothetical protein BGZ83_001889, partial [Gryganskiella cystojenkinii]
AETFLEEIKTQNTALISISNLHLPPWSNIQTPDPAEDTTSLVKAVQDRNRRHAKIENLPDLPQQPSRNDIQSALKTYHAPDLFILRVSGQELDLGTCFVNLAIAEAPAHRQKERLDLKKKAEVFHRISSFERVKHTDTKALIPLEYLFDKRRLRDGRVSAPKRILVQGRAGIGKTTLCKKLVHAHQNGLWKDLFDIILWLPLRQLRGSKSRTLEGLFREKVFTAQNLDQEQEALARSLAFSAQEGKVLFILDGLDEIVTDAEGDESKAFRSFLKTLLCQQHVVITSRPSGLDSTLLPPIDLELETVGFSQQNVKDFVVKVLEPKAAETVQDFIQRTPLIQELVNIPVQLDVICFSWDSLPSDGRAITMSGLYRLMVRKLWCKDAHRLKKTAGGIQLTQRQINQLGPEDIDELMVTELQHLGYLAFKGMNNKHQIEFDENDLLCAFRDLKDRVADKNRLLPPQLVEVMKQTSFLHTVDTELNSNGGSRQAWHFLHLTFQEYFAATWIVRHFHIQPCLSAGMMTKEQATEFIHQHKYDPQYEIVWSMVAGLLEGEPLHDFFGFLQGAPRDLIGGRHQQILASCLNEARARLDLAVVTMLDAELRRWFYFELFLNSRVYDGGSRLGSRTSFPETLLFESLNSVCSWKSILIQTLEVRSTISESAIQYLVGSLKDSDREVRYSAASALSKRPMLPESAMQSLIAALNDDDEYVRSSAASALGKQSSLPESAVQSLIASLKDENQGVRRSAAAALRKQSSLPGSGIQSLIAALKDDDGYVRSSAAAALGEQSSLPESAVQSLIASFKDADGDVRSSAESALGEQLQSTLSEIIVQSLTAALKDKDENVGSSALSALGQSSLPESAVQSLIASLKAEDDDIKDSIALVLNGQYKMPESAIQSLIAALNDDDEYVKCSAAIALRDQSSLSESAVQSLIAALKDEAGLVRSSAASALGNQSSLPESAIQSLIAALKDDDRSVWSSAASALGKQSKLPESAIQFLIAALEDEDKYVRSSAASALRNQSSLPGSAVQSLIASLKDEEEDVRYSAKVALRNQSSLPGSGIQFLITALNDDDGFVRLSAVSALEWQSSLPESAVRSLIVALKDEAGYVRSSAASALGGQLQSTLSEIIIQSLIAALLDGDKNLRYSAASALGKRSMLPESAVQSLIAALHDDDEHVRSSAASALGEQSSLPESAVRSLIASLKNEDEDVRHSVSKALRDQCHSLWNSFSQLTEDEVACLYENHLFVYSCSHVVSLQ